MSDESHESDPNANSLYSVNKTWHAADQAYSALLRELLSMGHTYDTAPPILLRAVYATSAALSRLRDDNAAIVFAYGQLERERRVAGL